MCETLTECGIDIVVHLHLVDTRNDNDEHLPVGMGRIDFGTILDGLAAAGWSGTATLEIGTEGCNVMPTASTTDRFACLAHHNGEIESLPDQSMGSARRHLRFLCALLSEGDDRRPSIDAIRSDRHPRNDADDRFADPVPGVEPLDLLLAGDAFIFDPLEPFREVSTVVPEQLTGAREGTRAVAETDRKSDIRAIAPTNAPLPACMSPTAPTMARWARSRFSSPPSARART